MTEKEAGKKMCCGPDAFDRCIGARCMAWRWDLKANPDYQPHSAMSFTFPSTAPPMYVVDTENGHCGLAGSVPL